MKKPIFYLIILWLTIWYANYYNNLQREQLQEAIKLSNQMNNISVDKTTKENPFYKWQTKIIEKFDKSKNRTKEFNLPWFLCFHENLSLSWRKLTIDALNCKNEENEKTVNFKFEENNFYKILNNSEKILIFKVHIFKKWETANKIINDKIIQNFPNNFERKACSPQATKKIKLENKLFNTVYTISPIWLYKPTSEKQLKKDPTTIICDWFSNPWDKFIITDKKTLAIEIIDNTKLIDLNNINLTVK